MKNDVWDVVPRPKRKSVVTSKWIYKIKHAADGSIDKYKARTVLHIEYSRTRHLKKQKHPEFMIQP